MNSSQYHVAVVGLGKVGLPLAVQYASHGANVVGCDINFSVVDDVNHGRTPIKDEKDLEDKLAACVREGTLRATTDTSEAVAAADVVVVIVPLMVDAQRDIDFSIIDAATTSVGNGLKKGTLVVFETTLPVGTTRNRIAKKLEGASGLVASEDFYVAFSPERIRTGQIFRDLATYPKVVGGLTPKDTRVAHDFYASVLDAEIMDVSSSEAAELTKLIETTYRDINIAVANEFATFAARRGLDVYEAIDAANSQPQSHVHMPGIGVGGHCIPVYPYFMINNATDGELQIAREARKLNDGMSASVVSDLSDELDGIEDKRAVVIGLSYRANVKESAFSVAFHMVKALEDAGFNVDVFDTLFTSDEIASRGLSPASAKEIDSYPVVAIQALNHDTSEVIDTSFPNAKVVIDGRRDLGGSTSGADQTLYRVGAPITRAHL